MARSTRAMGRAWVENDIDQMVLWAHKGTDIAKIAEKLGRTEKGIKSRMMELRIEGESHVTWRMRRAPNESDASLTKRKKAALKERDMRSERLKESRAQRSRKRKAKPTPQTPEPPPRTLEEAGERGRAAQGVRTPSSLDLLPFSVVFFAMGTPVNEYEVGAETWAQLMVGMSSQQEDSHGR